MEFLFSLQDAKDIKETALVKLEEVGNLAAPAGHLIALILLRLQHHHRHHFLLHQNHHHLNRIIIRNLLVN